MNALVARLRANTGVRRDVVIRDMDDAANALEDAETYLDECVEDLQNVDIAAMRRILRGPKRSDAGGE